MIPAIVSLCVLAAYIAATSVMCKGVPSSVSSTFYQLKSGWIFTIVLWIVVFTLLPTWLEVGNPHFQFLVFLSCAGLAFVAAAPNFKDIDHNVHVGATAVCAMSAMAWVLCHVPMLIALWFGWVMYIAVQMRGGKTFIECKPLFWAEVTAFAITYSAIFIVG